MKILDKFFSESDTKLAYLLQTIIIYFVGTVITAAMMRDLDFIQSLFLLPAAISIVWGRSFYSDHREYHINLSIIALLACTVLSVVYLVGIPAFKIKQMNTYLAFAISLAQLILLVSRIPLVKSRVFNVLLLMIILLPSLVIWGYYFSDGVWISPTACLAILHTNFNEAKWYILDSISLKSGAVVATLVFLTFCIAENMQNLSLKKWAAINIAGIVFFTIFNVALLYRTGRTANIVIEVWQETQDYIKGYQKFVKLREQREGIVAKIKNNIIPGQNGIYVLVIGESATKSHLSAFGYNKVTTPWLDNIKNKKEVLLYQNAYTCFPATVQALSYALTNRNQYNEIPMEDAVSVMEVAKAAGYETVWISTQPRYGSFNSPQTAVGGEANQQIWLNDGSNLKTDISIAERLDDIKYTDRMFIVIHLMGSHFPYVANYPKDWEKAIIQDDTLMNEYDNSILYTDLALQKITERLFREKDFRSLVYFSDHGEGIDQHLKHNADTLDMGMLNIPMVIYLSPQYIETNPQKYANLQNMQNKIFTNDLIFNLCLGLMDVKLIEGQEDNNDLTSNKYDNAEDRFKTIYGKAKVSEIKLR